MESSAHILGPAVGAIPGQEANPFVAICFLSLVSQRVLVPRINSAEAGPERSSRVRNKFSRPDRAAAQLARRPPFVERRAAAVCGFSALSLFRRVTGN